MSKRGAVYAAPDDRENLTQGAFLVRISGSSQRDTPRNRQQALEQLLDSIDLDRCFANGLGASDLIFIPLHCSPAEIPMSAAPEEHDIILAAAEIIELAKLKVDLAKAFLAAQDYKDLVIKVVAPDSGHLTATECEQVADKSFAKTLKGLAEAKVKVTQWYENSTGRHELILNELTFMESEIADTLAIGTGKADSQPSQSAPAKAAAATPETSETLETPE